MIEELPGLSGPTVKRHKSSQSYGTPWPFIRACEAHFGRRVAWDLAAHAGNAKAAHWYTEADNALVQSWHRIQCPGGMLWLNPPFGDVAPWAEKCAEEAAHGTPILLLTPASVGANWFRDHIHGRAHVLVLNGRIVFDGQTQPEDWQPKKPGQQWKPDPYPKDCMLSAYNLRPPGFDVWTWEK